MTAESVPGVEAPPLAAEGLAKTYITRKQGAIEALMGFSLHLEPGDGMGLLGPNGSGKTTAIHLLLGLEKADRGSVRIFGHDPIRRHARARLGYLPEETALFPFLTAEETLHLAGRLHGLGRRRRCRRVDELLTVLGLHEARRRRVSTYSRGMARRLAFSRAVFHSPSLLVLDEPTSGLDPEGADVVFDLIRKERDNGCAVLFSTHMLREAEAQCSRLTLLVRGRIARSGSLDELLGEEEEGATVTGLDRAARSDLSTWVGNRGGEVESEGVRRRSLERLFRTLLEEEGHP